MDPSSPCLPAHYPQVLSTKQTDTGCIVYLRVPDDLAYLEGHFPQAPIVAGVCQLKWVIDYIELHTGKPLVIEAMEAVKFHRPLLPQQLFAIELSYDDLTTTWYYQVYAADKSFASGRLIVQP
jgi:3-hydroxymyristoyl/3-hydroxydecanoyl-(acyl carrier protein) dehydratase